MDEQSEIEQFSVPQALGMLPPTKLQHAIEVIGDHLVLLVIPTYQMQEIIKSEGCVLEKSTKKFIDMKYPLKVTAVDRPRPMHVYVE